MIEEAFLHVDVDETDLSGVLTQGHKNNYKVVSMVGRELMWTEQCCSIIERLAIATAWCVKKLNRYTHFLAAGPGLTIIYPHADEAASPCQTYLCTCKLRFSNYPHMAACSGVVPGHGPSVEWRLE